MPSGGSGKSGSYYTTKGMGSTPVYNAYYETYGTSQVWGHAQVGTQANIASVHKGGSGPFKSTDTLIRETRAVPGGLPPNNLLRYGIVAVLLYMFL